MTAVVIGLTTEQERHKHIEPSSQVFISQAPALADAVLGRTKAIGCKPPSGQPSNPLVGLLRVVTTFSLMREARHSVHVLSPDTFCPHTRTHP